MIYAATSKKGFKIPGYLDPNTSRNIGFIYRPNIWITSNVYFFRNAQDYDVVVPTTFNGYYYQVSTPGTSGPTEPVWATIPGGITIDGTTGLTWVAVAYNLLPPILQIASSSWFVVGALAPWATGKSHAIGDTIQATLTGDQFICTAITGSATTGALEPTWNVGYSTTGAGLTTVDNAAITWTYTGSIAYLGVTSFTTGTTQAVLYGSANMALANFTVTNRTIKNDGTTDDKSMIFAVANT